MRFWILAPVGYLLFLAATLLLPVAALWDRQPMSGSDVLMYIGTGISLLAAAFMACLMVAKLLFPQYWWMAAVQGQDVYQLDGVYFVGLRLSRVPGRLQRLLFGADEQFRWWDILLGISFLVLLLPHVLAAGTAYREADRYVARRIEFPESLHAAVLSSLPVMREWGEAWSPSPGLAARIAEESERLQVKSGKTDRDWMRLAQLHLLRAYTLRRSVTDPYSFSPGDRVFFDRGRGGQASSLLNQVLGRAQGDKDPLRSEALTLLGFIQLSETNFPQALQNFEAALKAAGDGAAGAFPRPLVALLAGHAATLTGDAAKARGLLEPLLSGDKPGPAIQALALEHLAAVLRAERGFSQAQELLRKAAELYAQQKDAAGEGRVHLRRAALLLDQGDAPAASEEISRASSQVSSANDVFTLNMVERIIHLVPAGG
jgi:tetratricopeptide (TPR) repeat protein